MVDDNAVSNLSQTPAVLTSDLFSNDPTLAGEKGVGSNSIHTTVGGPALTKCVQGHVVYCSQCATAHSILDSDEAGES